MVERAVRRGRILTDEEYERLALSDPSANWELWCGRPRRKPPMTFRHGDIAEELSFMLRSQLDRGQYRIRSNKGRVSRPTHSYYIPDLFVIPRAQFEPMRAREEDLEAYAEPLPLVVEVWSPSTGRYPVREKLEEYKRRGDREIWYIHPCQRTLTAWRRQADGSYTETLYRGGTVRPVALPDVIIDFDALFEG